MLSFPFPRTLGDFDVPAIQLTDHANMDSDLRKDKLMRQENPQKSLGTVIWEANNTEILFYSILTSNLCNI